jgi:lysophospholipase L1-like esterase
MKSKFKRLICVLILVVSSCIISFCQEKSLTVFKANNLNLQYIGRIDFSNPELPRFWTPGVYVRTVFTGKNCEIIINDEVLWGKSHNYISVIVDNRPAKRIKLTDKVNVLKVADNLSEGKHTLLVCKSTEANIGYIEFAGIKCSKLEKPSPLSKRKIEFYGNSITCGTGSDLSDIPCDKAEWYDQHNAYMSYGPVTARLLNAQWMLTSFSGIGLVHSCCDMKLVMPDVYDKVSLSENKIEWDFSRYQPDVVTVALGQNDGIQDSAFFCSKYVEFLHALRKKYPSSSIVCLTSPMANEELKAALKKYLTAIVAKVNSEGDKNVTCYFFSRSWNNGCGGHPDLAQHTEIAKELAAYIKKLKKW